MMETVVKRTFLSAEYMDKAWAHNNSNASYIHDELLLGGLGSVAVWTPYEPE